MLLGITRGCSISLYHFSHFMHISQSNFLTLSSIHVAFFSLSRRVLRNGSEQLLNYEKERHAMKKMLRYTYLLNFYVLLYQQRVK